MVYEVIFEHYDERVAPAEQPMLKVSLAGGVFFFEIGNYTTEKEGFAEWKSVAQTGVHQKTLMEAIKLINDSEETKDKDRQPPRKYVPDLGL